MGQTLNLCDSLLAMGRDYQQIGRLTEATRVLKRLAGFRDLPAATAEETHARLAALALKRGDFPQARKHLTTVLFYRPSNAFYYYQFAVALHRDAEADASRAVRYYKQSLQLDAEQPRCWTDYGRLLLQIGKPKAGVKALRNAAKLTPDDPAVVAKLVEGLCLAGRAKEAKTVLKEARFRNPRDLRFRKLWNDFQYDQVRDDQAVPPAVEEPVILPFVRRAAVTTGPKGPGRVVRMDRGSKSAPYLPKPSMLPDTKHAP